jgi:hypothetical protein
MEIVALDPRAASSFSFFAFAMIVSLLQIALGATRGGVGNHSAE